MTGEVSIPEEAFEAAAMPLATYMARSDTYDAASDALRVAAPLIVAANSVSEIPDEVVARAWDECIYPRNAVEHPPGPGFLRAIAEINQWLTRRASVLRGEETR